MRTTIASTLIIFFMSSLVQAAEFRLNSGAPESLSNEKGDAFYNLISNEIFKRLGISLTYLRQPSERSLIEVNNGEVDGNIARVKGIEKKWKNIVQVPESIIEWEFVAFSLSDEIKINDWQSLKSYPVGYVRGWQIYQKQMKDAEDAVKVNGPKELFEMLRKGHIKIALFERLQSNFWFNKLNYKPVLLQPMLAKKHLFIYLNKKHKELVPRMVEMIKQMKNDGTYQRIYNQSFND